MLVTQLLKKRHTEESSTTNGYWEEEKKKIRRKDFAFIWLVYWQQIESTLWIVGLFLVRKIIQMTLSSQTNFFFLFFWVLFSKLGFISFFLGMLDCCWIRFLWDFFLWFVIIQLRRHTFWTFHKIYFCS